MRRVVRELVVLGVLVSVAHDDARADPTGDAASRPARVRPQERTTTCLGSGCHDDIVNRPVVHGPVLQRNCAACHTEQDAREHTFRIAMPRERMCVGCHTLPMRDIVHAPVAVGDCTGCHDPHGSEHRMMLRADPATQLCVTCHSDLGFLESKVVHGPVAAGACILCHDAHSSWHRALLTRAPEEGCTSCHAEVRDALRTQAHVHQPVVDGRCTDCHNPHASEAAALLRTDIGSLCLGCHEPIRLAIDSSDVVHGPASGDDACIDCHVGHASDLPKLQRNAQPDGCLSCHNQPLQDESGQTLPDMATMLRTNPFHHGPIREGNCTACHDPHASSRFRLLSADYPPEFYAPFNEAHYRLCFGCHRPEMVTSATGVGVTNFRDGDRNLHHLHVNQEKGRTCRACHEVHASESPFLIRRSVPFGNMNWMLEINYTKLETGGSCAPGCHKPETYSRVPTTTGQASPSPGDAP
ncbi:MAG: cytochrome c3 family protein [Phycisphaerae bacterium]|nr:cytochrome c3 family protein [Phycisphaerae bacterium]